MHIMQKGKCPISKRGMSQSDFNNVYSGQGVHSLLTQNNTLIWQKNGVPPLHNNFKYLNQSYDILPQDRFSPSKTIPKNLGQPYKTDQDFFRTVFGR